jgi:hypothetical protein
MVKIVAGQRDGECFMAHAPLEYRHILAPGDGEAMGRLMATTILSDPIEQQAVETRRHDLTETAKQPIMPERIFYIDCEQ